MTWTHIPHTRCAKPFLGTIFAAHGAIWTCDVCGKRWMVDRTPTADGFPSSRWKDLAAHRLAALNDSELSMEPADVGRRERAKALLWLDHHVDGIYADLGLERTR